MHRNPTASSQNIFSNGIIKKSKKHDWEKAWEYQQIQKAGFEPAPFRIPLELPAQIPLAFPLPLGLPTTG
jgi:hypothetical protein